MSWIISVFSILQVALSLVGLLSDRIFAAEFNSPVIIACIAGLRFMLLERTKSCCIACAGVSTSQLNVAGVGSTFPDLSIACTWNV